MARRKALVAPMVDEAPPAAYRLPAQTESGGSRLDGARVLVVSMYYRPETTGSAPYTADLAEHLAAMGAHVRVVAAQPHYPAWRRPEGVPNALTVSHEDGVEVVRVPGYVPRRPTLLRRALYELAYVSAARHHLGADDADLVLACTPSLFAGWLAARAAAKAGVPCMSARRPPGRRRPPVSPGGSWLKAPVITVETRELGRRGEAGPVYLQSTLPRRQGLRRWARATTA